MKTLFLLPLEKWCVVIMNKNNPDNPRKRGCDALLERLQNNGASSIEIEEARDCFRKGIEILKGLFLSSIEKARKANKGAM